MGRSALQRALALSSAERRVLTRAVWTLAAARVLLKLLPFARVRRLLTPRPGSPTSPWITIVLVRWAIDVAQRVIPDATCLPQALTAESLLTRAGLPVELRIGVMKDQRGRFEAHAWAQSGTTIVVGNLPDLRSYAPMPPLPAAWANADAASPTPR